MAGSAHGHPPGRQVGEGRKGPGRAARTGELRERARSLSAEAFRIKGSSYALAKNP